VGVEKTANLNLYVGGTMPSKEVETPIRDTQLEWWEVSPHPSPFSWDSPFLPHNKEVHRRQDKELTVELKMT
jgi:hypothetical protein